MVVSPTISFRSIRPQTSEKRSSRALFTLSLTSSDGTTTPSLYGKLKGISGLETYAKSDVRAVAVKLSIKVGSQAASDYEIPMTYKVAGGRSGVATFKKN